MVYYGVYYDAAVFFTIKLIPVLWSPKFLVKNSHLPTRSVSGQYTKAVTGLAKVERGTKIE